jgi:pimeloyl-ACP methyl ester carboxylesterase
MFDQGAGPPLVVVPGIQGRWEWLRPALRELSVRCRTVSYTLAGDFGARFVYEPEIGFDNYLRQLDMVLDRAGIERAAICGVSYGGLIALRYAVTRPRRVSALILASSPAPGWKPNARQARYVARPWVSAPAFVATAPMRIVPEICAAYDTWGQRLGFAVAHAARVLAAPMLPPVMARRVRVQQAMDFAPDCPAVKAPTLVLAGEPGLDRIVSVEVTRSYERMIPGARYETLERTGHLGVVTRPKHFAELVAGFTYAHRD